MKRIINYENLLLIVAILWATQLHAQAPTIEWQKYLGGSNWDYPSSLEQTFDGGYIIVGTSSSSDGDVSTNHGSSDIWITKLDHLGIIQWEKSIGDTYIDGGLSVEQTIDSGYIVAGFSKKSNGTADGLVIKLTKQGSIVQKILLGGLGDDYITSIQQTTDGGYIFAGYTTSTDGGFSGNHGNSDFWIGKLGIYFIGGVPSLHLIWQKLFGGVELEHGNSILQTPDGGYIFGGNTFSNNGDVNGNHGHKDGWIVKSDNIGNLQWEKTLGGSFEDHINSIQLTSDSGFILCGYSNSNDGDVSGNHGDYDEWIVKLNQNGNIQWQKSFGGSSSDMASDIQETSDGGYIVSGISKSIDGDVTTKQKFGDYWILRLDNLGNIQWQKLLARNKILSYSLEERIPIRETPDGGYIIAGRNGSENGNQDMDYWIVKLSSEATSVKEMENKKDFTVFPNPFTDKIVIKDIPPNTDLAITNILGEIVYKTTTQGSPETLDLSKLPIGLYFISIEGKIVKKIMKSEN